MRLSFWSAYLTTMRPYLMPVSGLAGLAGMSLAGIASPWVVGLGLLVFTLSYGFGQALTDCFQQDTDRLSAPYRPLVCGEISTRQVLSVSLTGLLLSVVVLAIINPWNLLISACAIVGLVVYTPLKRRWWAGPIANAWVVALVPVMGWLMYSGNNLLKLGYRPEVFVVGLVSFSAYGNFVLVGYLKDIRADRQTGYNTFPVRFGWKQTAYLSHIWAGIALAAATWAVWLLRGTELQSAWPGWLVLGLSSLLSIFAQATLHRVHSEDKAYFPIINVVRVSLLLQIAVVLAAKPGWWPLAVALYTAFESLIRIRPERCQV